VPASNGIIHAIDAVLLPPVEPVLGNLVEVATADGRFARLLDLATTADLVGALTGPGPLTLFAPTDAAFVAFSRANPGVLRALELNPGALRDVLLHHVVDGRVDSAAVVIAASLQSLAGTQLDIEVLPNGLVRIDGAIIRVLDVPASNGIIHVIDAVMVPPPGNVVDVIRTRGLATLTGLIETAGLTDALSQAEEVTVFAPTEAAFQALARAVPGILRDLENDVGELTRVLTYHVVAGRVDSAAVALSQALETLNGAPLPVSIRDGVVFVGNARIEVVDIPASNGVVHLIDAVLVPPVAPVLGNLIEVARDAGAFGTLLAAVEAAGLTEALSAPDANLTVFAPTDAAFAALGDEAIQRLLADVDSLTRVLTYHVAPGRLTAAALAAVETLPTLLGEDLALRVEAGTIFVDDVAISVTNVFASNGIIHVIDAVLPPPPGTIIEVARAAGAFSTLLAALDAANLTDALDDPDAELTVFAPTDAAFAALEEANPGTIEALLADVEALAEILTYHVVAGRLAGADIAQRAALVTLEGRTVEVIVVQGALFIDGVRVTVADVAASNGVIHVIDAVLVPSPAENAAVEANPARIAGNVGADEIDTYTVQIDATSRLRVRTSDGDDGCPGDTVVTVIGEAGVVAVNDDGGPRLCSLVETIVEPGEYTIQVRGYAGRPVGEYTIDIDHARVVEANSETAGIGFERGGNERYAFNLALESTVRLETLCDAQNTDTIVTLFDADGAEIGTNDDSGDALCSLLSVDLEAGEYTVTVTGFNGRPINDYRLAIDAVTTAPIIDVLREDDRFSTLVTLLEATDLDAALADRDAELTVLAPTNPAFDALEAQNPGILDQLANDPETLRSVLLYHVLPLIAPAEVVVGLDSAPTLLGPDVAITVGNGAVRINGVRVVDTDIQAGNGIVHALGGVLLPPAP
jgi:transforming growth factor-beta-induced protein